MVAESAPGPTPDRQVLVVGSGLDGVATAAFLDQRGLSPVVVSPPHDTAPTRPVILWPSALALLSTVDIAPQSVGTPIRRWVLRHTDRTATGSLTSAHGEPHPVVAADRSRLRKRLRARLPPGCVRLSKTPRGVRSVDDGLAVDFADGVRERFDVVVAADGPRSWLRRVQFDERPVPWGTTTWTLAVDPTASPSAAIAEVATDSSILSCGPHGSARGIRLVTSAPDPDADATARQPRALAPTTGEAVPPSSTTTVDRRPDCVVPVERWTAGHTALVGRAARSLPPCAPLDASLAIEDAAVLAAELAASSVTSALDTYARRRRDRHGSLARHAPFEDRFLSAHRDPVAGCWSFRRALLRSFFAGAAPPMSAAVTEDR